MKSSITPAFCFSNQISTEDGQDFLARTTDNGGVKFIRKPLDPDAHKKQWSLFSLLFLRSVHSRYVAKSIWISNIHFIALQQFFS